MTQRLPIKVIKTKFRRKYNLVKMIKTKKYQAVSKIRIKMAQNKEI